VIHLKKKKWLLLLIPAVLLLAAALVWFLYLSPRMTLSNAADDALSMLEQRLGESPVPILAKGYDESGRNTTSLALTVSDGVQYDMQVQTDLTSNQILADGTIRIDGKALNLSAYLDKEFAAITSEDLFKGGYYGITYDTFSSDVRSFPLLSRLIPSATLSKLDSSVEKLQVYMNRTRQIPQLPEVQEEDIHKLILGLLVLKSDVHKETLTVDGQSLECLRFDYSATGEQAGTLLGYLMADFLRGTLTLRFISMTRRWSPSAVTAGQGRTGQPSDWIWGWTRRRAMCPLRSKSWKTGKSPRFPIRSAHGEQMVRTPKPPHSALSLFPATGSRRPGTWC